MYITQDLLGILRLMCVSNLKSGHLSANELFECSVIFILIFFFNLYVVVISTVKHLDTDLLHTHIGYHSCPMGKFSFVYVQDIGSNGGNSGSTG